MDRKCAHRLFAGLSAPIWALLSIGFLVWPANVGAQPFAYVANDVAHNVSVIDASTRTVVATIDIGGGSNPASVAVAPDGVRVYVANNPTVPDEGTVSVIDTTTNTVTGTIATGGGPYGIAITPDGTALYVTNFYGSPTNNVWVIDPVTQTVTHSITVGSYPHAIAVTPDGAFVYVANALSNTVSVINTNTKTVTATVSVGDTPHGLAISPDGSLVYVTNYNSGTVSVIDSAVNAVTATITLSTDAIEGVAFSKNGELAYVCHQHANFLSVIDTNTHAVINTIEVGLNPFGLALQPGGGYLYVTNQSAASVSVVNTQTHIVEATVPTAPGSFPANVAFTPSAAPRFDICPLYDLTKAAKRGSTISIRLQLCDGAGNNLSSPDLTVVATTVIHVSNQVTGTVEDSGNANPEGNFRYDASLGGSGGYIFNLSTKTLASGTFSLSFSVSGDPSEYSTTFQVK